jgi:hypothetical protein
MGQRQSKHVQPFSHFFFSSLKRILLYLLNSFKIWINDKKKRISNFCGGFQYSGSRGPDSVPNFVEEAIPDPYRMNVNPHLCPEFS